MHALRIAVLLALAAALSASTRADEPSKPTSGFRSLDELNSAYERQIDELDRRRISDLATLARKAGAAESEAAYAQLLHIAIDRGLLAEAGDAADRCLAAEGIGREVKSLATMVRVGASAERGDDATALARLKAFLKERGRSASSAEVETAVAVGESYLGRVLAAGRYGPARSLCEFATEMDGAPDALKGHFAARLARIERVGQPAPPLSGPDVDGARVSLEGLKGKVVLVDFWATWCPPCVAEIPRLERSAEKHRGRGFEILGINVDAAHQEARGLDGARPIVRQFLIEHKVSWTNILDGPDGELASAYGVQEIPSSFLVGRDGKVIAFDLSGDELERAVEKALAVGGR